MYQLVHGKDCKMSSIFGGCFDAPQTPMMTWGDEDSMEESKVPDSGLIPVIVAETIPMVRRAAAALRKPLHKFSMVMMMPKTGMQKF